MANQLNIPGIEVVPNGSSLVDPEVLGPTVVAVSVVGTIVVSCSFVDTVKWRNKYSVPFLYYYMWSLFMNIDFNVLFEFSCMATIKYDRYIYYNKHLVFTI